MTTDAPKTLTPEEEALVRADSPRVGLNRYYSTRILATLDAARAEAEQLRTQLAGCSVAALGGANGNNDAVRGMYGWSVAFEDVKTLRKKYETGLAEARAAEARGMRRAAVMAEALAHLLRDEAARLEAEAKETSRG